MSSLEQRLAAGTRWSVVGALVGRGLSFAAAVMVARILGPHDYGELAMLQSSAALLQVLGIFGLATAATNYVAQYQQTRPEAVGQVIAFVQVACLVLSTVLASLAFAGAPWFAERVLLAPNLTLAVRIGALLVIGGALENVQAGVLAGLHAFRSLAYVQSAGGMLSVVMVPLAAHQWGTVGALGALAVCLLCQTALGALVIAFECRSGSVHVLYRSCLRERRLLLNFSLPLVLGNLTLVAVPWIAATLLVSQPAGYEQMGVLSVANHWLTALTIVPTVLVQPLLPILSEQLALSRSNEAIGVLRASARMSVLVVWPLVAACVIASPWIICLYGPAFERSLPTLVVSLLTAAVVAIIIPSGQVMFACRRIWPAFLLNLGWGVLVLFGAWLLIDRGAFGVAMARLAGYVALGAGTVAYGMRLLRAVRRDET